MGLRGLGEGAQGLMCGSSASRNSDLGLGVHNTGLYHLGSMLLLLLLRLLLLAEAEQL